MELDSLRVVSQAFDSWNVQFRVAMAELVDQQTLLRHLRQIKRKISEEFSVPETSLLFDGIVRRVKLEDSVDVVVRIKKQIFEKGNPVVHFKDGIGADMNRHTHMTALLSIFYLDEFDKPITLARVMQAVAQASIKENLLDEELIGRKLKEVLENRISVKNIPIAKGIFPDIGTDAVLEFFFQAAVTPDRTDEYYSSRKVARGDLLCRKTPPSEGRRQGISVIGGSLPPRSGQDIELKTGQGAEVSLDEQEIVADTDGIVIVTRSVKRVNLVNGVKEIPELVLISVKPVLKVEGNQVLDIASSQALEIIGDLHVGSRIVTDAEVFVSGDVEEGTLIEAAYDVTVQGDVRGASLTSQGNVITCRNVSDSQVVAREQVIIKGEVQN